MGIGKHKTAAVVVAAIVAFTTHARATPSAKLVYVREAGASACPAEADLRKAVASRIGYDPFFPTASKTVIAQISRAPHGYRGRVQIVGDDGNVRGARDLSTRGDDCSELLSALALAISIALDDLDDGQPAPAAVEDANAAAPPVVAPEAAPPPPPAERPRDVVQPAPAPVATARRIGFLASAGPITSFGFAPAASVGASFAATFRYSFVAARLAVRADLPASGDLPGSGTLSTSAILGSASACVRGDLPFVCAGVGLGTFSFDTSGIRVPSSGTTFLVTVPVSAGVDLPLSGQIYAEPFVEGGLVLTRHQVAVDRVEGYRLPVFTGTGGIHLGWRFL